MAATEKTRRAATLVGSSPYSGRRSGNRRKVEIGSSRTETRRMRLRGIAGTEYAPERIEQIDLRRGFDGHRAMGQLVQSGSIDLATLEQRQLSYHIRRNAPN